ncbi:SDR family oxidoreductase [Mucilaginibacter rubeus]|uniref:SDR family oxidoreductase n=1 Tax=Mucilaginibacter rubeus TaxID=2027860 RepID=A0AAE6MJT7_9SPHI|nr:MULTISPECIES: SDR family oxidoreductase [Mucilaginibacter]QEM06018.1 SDR family oxidoreductase [Mucilaginibacter rubeus]QEM18599.1 SDR family oxidoreductase [Mucilaginibacter gossypii]QTE44859.1 SDR family oxidoreductase [Mucilaginibacter rubeus]QTE51457.1 SDR family oxidoreductase [Mucilaginibacter rubeus]QTE56543.1 SDR family oxidoreductase [Mucilaginibacter rubeus]
MNSKTKLAIVTGGASGLGLATTKKFTEEGIKTIIIGRDEAKLIAAVTQLGDLCSYRQYDLSDTTGIPQLIAEIEAEFGAPDILVNNAGINHKKAFAEVTDEEFARVIQTNLTSIFAISREVVKIMLKAGSGSIINISSMAAQYGIPYVIAYTASKTAIEGMTKAMATELSPQGIRINCVAPGFIATDMSAKALDNDPARKQKVMGRTPMGKLGEPADVAEAVYYLATDTAKYVTGVVLQVDGGNSIGF